LKALETVRSGALGRILWVRSREAHSGPHSAWFWDHAQAGGGAIVDLGCHCIEIIRSFIGKEVYPREVLCWADTLVHPVKSEDNSVTLIRFDGGVLGQFEVSWTFRGGMDLRDEVSGTEGTIWLNHFLRTGFEVYSSAGGGGYVAEKAEAGAGWTFPVGDELEELGYGRMFDDMFRSMEAGQSPRETFYDGYVVNAVIDACYRSAESKRWEPVDLDPWRGSLEAPPTGAEAETVAGNVVVKRERMPDGRLKTILKDPASGRFSERFEDG
jgi:predicted dehydrogenase